MINMCRKVFCYQVKNMSDKFENKDKKSSQTRKEQRFEREAAALRKNLEKRKKQQEEREKLKKS